MASERRIAEYKQALLTILGRPLNARDRVLESRLRRAEKRLSIALPPAVREFYSVAGAAREVREHNRLLHPEELVIEQGCLVFMEENQAVVHWGVPLRLKRRADPRVWQRAHGEKRRWYSEKMAFSEFILKNLAWQRGVELSNNGMQLTSGTAGRASRALH
jgi:hypothetical protein